MNIGLLLPRSVLYPSISFDIIDGLKAALKKLDFDEAQVVTTSIGVAAKSEDIYASCEQLLFNGIDVIVGYMNPHWTFPNSETDLAKWRLLPIGLPMPSVTHAPLPE